MISKFYEINKYKKKIDIFLLYGDNEGQKIEVIKSNFGQYTKENTYKYYEKDILLDKQSFFENILSKSFFEKEKLILIFDVTDKLFKLIEETIEVDLTDVKIILIAKKLEKRSKLRVFFEKEKNVLIVPFYEDTPQNLIPIAKDLLNKNKINLSQEHINLIIERSQGDRINLKNELEKIITLSQSKKKFDINDILKLTNLSENYSASELVDYCLCKNKKKTLNILNENISSSDENVLILRTFLYKLKRLKKLVLEFNKNKNIEATVNSFKPPIFWKDKIIVKQQIMNWKLDEIRLFIVKINNIECLIKKNPQISNEIMNDMILEKLSTTNI
tara:strand:+ start:1027 stop:2019 length:993 start_codon:yes stop_codon:yes gene_type:complete